MKEIEKFIKDLKTCSNYELKINNPLELAEKLESILEENKIYSLSDENIQLKLYIKDNYILKKKLRNIIANETIDISGFECISVEDLKELF